MSAVVLRGDAAHLPLPDESIDAIVCPVAASRPKPAPVVHPSLFDLEAS